MRPLAAYLRSLNPELPRNVWVLQGGSLANFFGNGVVLPFLIIYLHNVRGISLTVAGLIAATNSAVAIPTGLLAGTLVDRLGARRVLSASLVMMAASISLFPLITEAWHAFALNGALGLGSGAFWPSAGVMLAALTPAHRRHAAFGLQRVTMSLGFGLGGLTGGLIAAAGSPRSFTVLFLLDAATFLAFALVLTRLPSPAPHPRELAGSYRTVFRNRPFVGFAWLNILFIAFGVVLLSELLPVFVKNEAGVSESLIGVFFLVHTTAIVVAQLPITKWSEGRRRMVALVLTRLPSPPPHPREQAGSYRTVLRNRPFVGFAWLNVLFIAFGVVLLSELVPVFVKNEAGVSESLIGVFFLVHTTAIVVAQLPITKWSEGRRRMVALAAMAFLWAACWLALLALGAWLHGAAAFGVLAGVAVVFALGACLHGTVGGPIIVDLAEPHLLGRYTAISSLSWQIGFVIGPAIGGAVLDAEPLALWPAAAAVLAGGAAAALALERILPAVALRNPKQPAAVPPLPPAVATEPAG